MPLDFFLIGILTSISCALSAKSSLLQILRNSSRRHSVLILLSVSSVTNLGLLFSFCERACCHTGASRWSGGQPKVSLPSLRSLHC